MLRTKRIVRQNCSIRPKKGAMQFSNPNWDSQKRLTITKRFLGRGGGLLVEWFVCVCVCVWCAPLEKRGNLLTG